MAHDGTRAFPTTVDEAADMVLSELSEEDKEWIKNIPRDALIQLHFGLGTFVRNSCGLWRGNDDLIEACRRAKYPEEDELSYLFMDPDDASAVIVEEVWRRLNA